MTRSLWESSAELISSARDLTWGAVLHKVALEILADCRCGNVDPNEFMRLVFEEMKQYQGDGTRSEEDK